MSYDTVEDLYSPSKWCRRYGSPEECLEDHVKRITKESELVREAIPGDLDISYGPLPKEKYDLFGTNLPGCSPILFYIHGGYWQEESIGRSNSSYVANVCYKHGVKTFVAGYELCPVVPIEQIVQQVQQALKVCLEYAERNGSRGIYLMGHSAGAHLVAHYFNGFTKTISEKHQQLLKAAFLIGGVYDLEPLLSTSYNIPLKLTSSSAKKLSPMNQEVHRCNTEFFVVVGRNDSPAFVSQSDMLDKKLNTEQIKSKLFVLDEIDHFDIIEKIVDEKFELTSLILETINEKL